jgi:hypothetical protein
VFGPGGSEEILEWDGFFWHGYDSFDVSFYRLMWNMWMFRYSVFGDKGVMKKMLILRDFKLSSTACL